MHSGGRFLNRDMCELSNVYLSFLEFDKQGGKETLFGYFRLYFKQSELIT